MPSTFTLSSGIEKPGSGEQSGTWGTTVNTNMDIIDRSMNGVYELGLTGTTSTLQTTDGTLSDGMYRFIRLTGSLSAAHTIDVLPADAQKIYYFKNETTDGGNGLQDVTIQQGTGTFVVPNGTTKVVYMDGNGTVDEIVFGTAFTTTNTGTGYGAINYSAGILDYSVVTDANIRSAISGTGDISFDQNTGVISYSGSGGTVNNSTVTYSGSNGVSGSGSFTLNQASAASISFSMSGSYTGTFTVSGFIRATSNITAYYSSDIRLKENIVNIPNALEKVSSLNGVTYDWTQEYMESQGGEDGFFVRKNDVGLIAQEVEKVLPEIVATNEEGYKAIKYERVVSLLVEAVKELKAELEEVRNAAAN